ncbi:hypothetical protein [Deinococcus ficus]|uniref:Uncharacterized protein n=1 Tax=Deinococcus ficus TaxID=317577 RepID=A0A221T1F8_9DEIO|nr:hypothetical protein [Deinococcus ficus]ASN82724.1 hypothetical protein DFI_16335 [Deinococcus ficus]
MGAPSSRPALISARPTCTDVQAHLPVTQPALHPDELAARLEAEGLTDVLARQQYGEPSVFAYADQLFRAQAALATTARHVEGATAPPVAWTGLLRGVVYALPGAAMALTVSLLATLPAGAPRGLSHALTAAVMLAWGWSQGFAVTGYRLSGAAQRRFVQRATLGVVPFGALAGAALSALQSGSTLADVLSCALITAFTAAVLCASSALLILRLVPLAVLAYLPACAGLLAQAAGHPFQPGLALGAVLSAAALPGAALFLHRPGPAGPVLPAPGWPAVSGNALSAWACAGFVALTWGVAPGVPGWAQGALPLLLPVILSLGIMEVLAEFTFRALRRHAAQHHSLTAVRRRAWRTALRSLIVYAAALLTLLLVSVGLSRPDTLQQPQALLLLILPALLYGSALMFGTLSATAGAPWWALAAWVLGIAALLSPLVTLPYGAVLAAALPVLVMAAGVHRALLHPHTYL